MIALLVDNKDTRAYVPRRVVFGRRPPRASSAGTTQDRTKRIGKGGGYSFSTAVSGHAIPAFHAW